MSLRVMSKNENWKPGKGLIFRCHLIMNVARGILLQGVGRH